MDQNVIEYKMRRRRLRNVPLTHIDDLDLLDYCYNLTQGVADTADERKSMIHAMQAAVAFMRKREKSDDVLMKPMNPSMPSEAPLPRPTRHHVQDTSNEFYV